MSDQMNEGAQAPQEMSAEQPTSAATPQPAESASTAEPSAPAEAAASAGPTPGEAWDEVVARLGELGDALSAWAKAAADTPENRQHLDEVRSGVNDMARQANEAFSAMADSEFGRQFAEGASQMGQTIGGTAQEFSQAAAPHVASAFAGLADAFGRAAQKVGEAASAHPAAEPPSRPAPEPPAPVEPPTPAAAAEPQATPDDTASEEPAGGQQE